jgi:SAM-dependent methyltransferase
VRAAVELRGDERIVDIGCGNGHDLAPLAASGHRGPLVGCDLSLGMLTAMAVPGALRVEGDASALPLRDGCADVVLALHMLYHVDDIPGAAAEARRVLAPGGTLVASTNSETAMPELIAVWEAALSAVAGRPVSVAMPSHLRFSVENGAELLGTAFQSVQVLPHRTRAEVPDAGVVRRYVDSTRDLQARNLPDPSRWDEAMDVLEADVAERIARHGTFTVTNLAALFVARAS